MSHVYRVPHRHYPGTHRLRRAILSNEDATATIMAMSDQLDIDIDEHQHDVVYQTIDESIVIQPITRKHRGFTRNVGRLLNA